VGGAGSGVRRAVGPGTGESGECSAHLTRPLVRSLSEQLGYWQSGRDEQVAANIVKVPSHSTGEARTMPIGNTPGGRVLPGDNGPAGMGVLPPRRQLDPLDPDHDRSARVAGEALGRLRGCGAIPAQRATRSGQLGLAGCHGLGGSAGFTVTGCGSGWVVAVV